MDRKVIRFDTLAAFTIAGLGAVLIALPNVSFARRNEFNGEILRASIRHDVSFNLIRAVVAQESGFDPRATARGTSASGLMQVTQAVVVDYNRANGTALTINDMFDPATNIEVGTWYLSLQISEFGVVGGLRAYFAGPGGFQRGERAAESASYARGVLSKLAAFTAETPINGVG